MHIVSPLVFHNAPRVVAVLALAGIVVAVLGLLAFVVLPFIGIDAPRLDGPELSPFRWTDPPSTVA